MVDLDFTYKARTRDLFQIEGSLTVKQPEEHLWNILTRPGYFKNFHPFCKVHEKNQLTGVGDRDKATFYSGKTMRRVVVNWNQGQSYTIKMDNDDGIETHVQFLIEREDQHQTNAVSGFQPMPIGKFPDLFGNSMPAFFCSQPLKNTYLRC